MKKITLIIKDSIIELLEIITLIGAFVIPYRINIPEIFKDYLTEKYPTPKDFLFFVTIEKGNAAIAIVLFLIVFKRIRKVNESILMNRENVYHDYPYLWYCFCAKILGIKKCNLVLVPIHIQFKLIINSIFDDYPINNDEYPQIDNKQDVSVIKNGAVSTAKIVNIILEDTYIIREDQIPYNLRSLPSIKISRNNGTDCSHHFSQQFVNVIVSEICSLRDGVTINVFATTNPKHNIGIAESAFKKADRGNISIIYVFQQKKTGDRYFEENGEKIYNS